MASFTYKGYGRIYTNPENIQDVVNIIQELDEFEWSYYPTGLVTSWDEYPRVDYVGKFELDKEKFQQICKERNIPVFVFDASLNDYPSGYYPERPLNKEEIKQIAFGQLQ